MADIDSQVSFSVTTESGEVRSMTPEEINAFVRQQIELASLRKGSTRPTQQTRRMRLARTPSPMSRFGRTNPLSHQPTETKSKNNVESIRSELSLDESFQRGAAQPQGHRPSTGNVQSMSRISFRGSTEDEKRSLSVDRQRQSPSPDQRDGVEEKRDSPVQFDLSSGRKALIRKHEPELRIELPTSPKKAAPSPDGASRHDEPVIIRRRSPSQTERKLKKAARNKASRRRADLFTATRTNITSDSEPFDENDQYSQISDTQATLFDSSMDISQTTHRSLKETREKATPREKKQLMSQPEIDMLIKHSINKARQARKIATSELEHKEKQQRHFEPKSRFDEFTGMSPLGGRNRKFSWSSVEDLDDSSTLDGTKSPKAAFETNDRRGFHEKATPNVTARSDVLATRKTIRSAQAPYDQMASTRDEVSPKPSDVYVSGSNLTTQPDSIALGNRSVKKPEGLTISTQPSALDALSPLNIPSVTSDRIYSQDEISAIVLLSMEKAQQAARDEIRSLLLTPKATDPKSPIAAKLAARLRVPSPEEVTSIAREAMHRAREAAQDEIRTLIRESFRCAQDSSQDQIRQIVRDSMQRARASAREEMSELVRNILRQGMESQQKIHHRAVTSDRKPETIAAEKLLISKGDKCVATDSRAETSVRPSEVKLEHSENKEMEEIQKETAISVHRVNRQITDDKSGEAPSSTDFHSKNTCEHNLTLSVSEGEKTLAGKLGLDTGRAPKTKFSFSQVDTQDEDQLQPGSVTCTEAIDGHISPRNHTMSLHDTQVQSFCNGSVSPESENYTNRSEDANETSKTTRDPSVESIYPDQTTGASASTTKQLEEDTAGHVVHRSFSPEKNELSQDKLATDDEDRDELVNSSPRSNLLQHTSAVETADNHGFEAFAADVSMVALSDGPSLSVTEEAAAKSNRDLEQPTELEDVKQRRKSKASRARHISGMTSPLSSMTPSDASTHSSFSASEDAESSTSSDSQSRRKSRKNRYRSGKNEAVVTDEFLQLIASKKGKRITAKDLGELIKQQQIGSPHSKSGSRLRRKSGMRGAHSFTTRPRASFEKQPRFCMVGNFMNFWEDLDLFLDEEESSEYQGNELLSFSTRGGSYTEFEDDDIEESFTEEARFDPNIVVSFSLQPSEEDESFVSEEEEETPKKARVVVMWQQESVYRAMISYIHQQRIKFSLDDELSFTSLIPTLLSVSLRLD